MNAYTFFGAALWTILAAAYAITWYAEKSRR